MPRDPNSGIYSPPANSAAIPGQPISSSSWNNLVADIGTEITHTIDPRGETPMAANLNMGGQKITNVTNGSASSDLANMGQLPSAPLGLIIWWPNTENPSSYVNATGGSNNISRTTYAGLFALLGTSYGSGDGSTTFTLPICNNDSRGVDVTICIKVL